MVSKLVSMKVSQYTYFVSFIFNLLMPILRSSNVIAFAYFCFAYHFYHNITLTCMGIHIYDNVIKS